MFKPREIYKALSINQKEFQYVADKGFIEPEQRAEGRGKPSLYSLESAISAGLYIWGRGIGLDYEQMRGVIDRLLAKEVKMANGEKIPLNFPRLDKILSGDRDWWLFTIPRHRIAAIRVKGPGDFLSPHMEEILADPKNKLTCEEAFYLADQRSEEGVIPESFKGNHFMVCLGDVKLYIPKTALEGLPQTQGLCYFPISMVVKLIKDKLKEYQQDKGK